MTSRILTFYVYYLNVLENNWSAPPKDVLSGSKNRFTFSWQNRVRGGVRASERECKCESACDMNIIIMHINTRVTLVPDSCNVIDNNYIVYITEGLQFCFEQNDW